MRSPFARFCQTTGELTSRGPRPLGLLVYSGDKNILIFLAFAFRPGLDEQDQLSAHHTMSHLQSMGRQFVTRGLPLLARPGRKKLQFAMRQLHLNSVLAWSVLGTISARRSRIGRPQPG
jgi:hypothetical protein